MTEEEIVDIGAAIASLSTQIADFMTQDAAEDSGENVQSSTRSQTTTSSSKTRETFPFSSSTLPHKSHIIDDAFASLSSRIQLARIEAITDAGTVSGAADVLQILNSYESKIAALKKERKKKPYYKSGPAVGMSTTTSRATTSTVSATTTTTSASNATGIEFSQPIETSASIMSSSISVPSANAGILRQRLFQRADDGSSTITSNTNVMAKNNTTTTHTATSSSSSSSSQSDTIANDESRVAAARNTQVLRDTRNALRAEVERIAAVRQLLAKDADSLAQTHALHTVDLRGSAQESTARVQAYKEKEARDRRYVRIAVALFCCLATYIAVRRLLWLFTGIRLPGV